MLCNVTKNVKYSQLQTDGSLGRRCHHCLHSRTKSVRRSLLQILLRGCDPRLVHRVPLLTSCYSSDMPSHKSARSDTGVRWPTDPGLVLVDKLNAFYLNTACQSLPVNRAGLRHGWMWHCGAMRRQAGPLRGQQEAGGRHHNSSSVHTQDLATNSKCKAQGALNIIAASDHVCKGGGGVEGIGWGERGTRGTGGRGGLDLGQSKEWWMTGNYW